MISSDSKLRERIKELKCLYELSRIAWESDNDIQTILKKTIKILPASMQFPRYAQAQIVLNGASHSTVKYHLTGTHISSSIIVGGKKCGAVQIGYIDEKTGRHFIPEEKKMLNAVARELSFIVQRNSAKKRNENCSYNYSTLNEWLLWENFQPVLHMS